MTRREELAREAARLFAEKGYHGTSIGALADAIGVQKGSLYAHIEGKQDLLFETMRQGAEAFHGALDEIPEELPATEKIRLALRAHLRVVAGQLELATVFVQEWRYLDDERRGRVRGRAPALRGARARATSARAGSRASYAPTSTRTSPRSSSSRRRTGRSRGCGREWTLMRSPTRSTLSWSTGCAATPPLPDRSSQYLTPVLDLRDEGSRGAPPPRFRTLTTVAAWGAR